MRGKKGRARMGARQTNGLWRRRTVCCCRSLQDEQISRAVRSRTGVDETIDLC